MTYTSELTAQTFNYIDALYEYGMSEIVISPGSRSTPLAIACELHEHIKTYIHPDERGAAYFAIGLSKKKKTTCWHFMYFRYCSSELYTSGQ